MKNNAKYPKAVEKILDKVDTLVSHSLDGSTSIAGIFHYRSQASDILELLNVSEIPEELHGTFIQKAVRWHKNGLDIAKIAGIKIDETVFNLQGGAKFHLLERISIGNVTLVRGMVPA